MKKFPVVAAVVGVLAGSILSHALPPNPAKPAASIQDMVQNSPVETAPQAADIITVRDGAIRRLPFANLTGLKGEKGDTGATGATGTAATIAVGAVTTGAASSEVQFSNSGSPSAAVFDVRIPKGDKGDTGNAGAQGIPGAIGPQGIQGIQGVQGIQGESFGRYMGPYVAETTYELKDIITFEGSTFICTELPCGEPPPPAPLP